MEFKTVAATVADVPHTPPELGRKLYDFVRSHGVMRILELGFGHGTSTCYLAAAVAANAHRLRCYIVQRARPA